MGFPLPASNLRRHPDGMEAIPSPQCFDGVSSDLIQTTNGFAIASVGPLVSGVFTWRAALEWTRADRVEPRFAPDAGSVSRRGNRYALSRNNPSWSRSTR